MPLGYTPLGYVYFEGWDYRQPPAADITDERNLEHADPWTVFCCILECAKRGDFSFSHRLPALWNTEDADLRFACQYLLASIGSEQQLRAFDETITAADANWRMETADHAALSGSLTFVDTFINGYRVAFGETTRAAMKDGLSNLLLTDPDSRVVTDCLLDADRPRGEARLRELATQQRNQFGAGVAFYRGAPLTAAAIIADIDRVLTEGEPAESFAHLQSLVTRLQTMVGFSQTGMFTESEDGTSDRWNEPLIRHHLERAAGQPFTPGIRYFFGHPAPL